jgi:hypothetical protein
MRLPALLVFIVIAYSTQAQTFSLDDILHARTMDSTQLITFARTKGFELKEVEMDGFRSVHRYYSSDSLTSFDRTFPTGRKLFPESPDRDHRMVYYRFADRETAKAFQKAMKAKGFKFKRTDTKDYGGNTFTHNIYLAEDQEIDLATQKLRGEKMTYTLIYYPRVN